MTVVIIKLSEPFKSIWDCGYIVTCKELMTDIVNIGDVVMLAFVTVVDLLCTKYAVLMNNTVLLVQQQNKQICLPVRPNPKFA